MDEEEKTAYFSELGLTEREVRMQVEGMSVTYLRISELCREAVSRYTECLAQVSNLEQRLNIDPIPLLSGETGESEDDLLALEDAIPLVDRTVGSVINKADRLTNEHLQGVRKELETGIAFCEELLENLGVGAHLDSLKESIAAWVIYGMLKIRKKSPIHCNGAKIMHYLSYSWYPTLAESTATTDPAVNRFRMAVKRANETLRRMAVH